MLGFAKKSANRPAAIFLSLILAVPLFGRAQTPGAGPSANLPATATHHKRTKKKPEQNNSDGRSSRESRAKTPSNKDPGAAFDSEIAAARSSNKVWVNLDSGVYHKSGRWYGRTKNGKFMTEAEAKAAGFKASQRN